MGYEKFFNIGDRLAIINDGEVYNSKIVRFVKKLKGVEHIVILQPNKNHIDFDLDDKKKKYEVLFYSKGGIYKGECKIKDRYKEDGIVSVVEILIASELEKYQRREYFRIDYIEKISYKILLLKNEETGEIYKADDKWYQGTLTNISGGGLRFNSREGNENVKKMLVRFKLRDAEEASEYEVNAEVVGVKIRSNSDKKYDYRIQFTDIEKMDRERIVRFIFERERWMRKKSIGKI